MLFEKRQEMNLVLDFGNTLTKIGLFENGNLQNVTFFEKENAASIINYLQSLQNIKHCIVSSVIDVADAVLHELSKYSYMVLDEHTSIPISNRYANPVELGKDRLAAAIGGHFFYPNYPVLIINAGTCITIDFKDYMGNFHGGAILPGLEMKLHALHNFTKKLPLIKLRCTDLSVTGTDTESSILSGVVCGTCFELDGFIDEYLSEYQNLKIILSGGDADCFNGKLNHEVSIIPHIVLLGLNQILDFNVENNKN